MQRQELYRQSRIQEPKKNDLFSEKGFLFMLTQQGRQNTKTTLLFALLAIALSTAVIFAYANSVNCVVACQNDTQCDDQNPNTIDVCNNDGQCGSDCKHIHAELGCQVECSSDSQCDDQNPETTDVCNNDGTCQAECTNIRTGLEQGCEIACDNDSQCDDQNPETVDVCNNDGTCQAECSQVLLKIVADENKPIEESAPRQSSSAIIGRADDAITPRLDQLPDASGRPSNMKRLYTDSHCGDTEYLQIAEEEFVHRLQNKCLRADFSANLSDIRVYSLSEEKEYSLIPISIEEMNPRNTLENFHDDEIINAVEFASSNISALFQEKPNILAEEGFEKGRLSWNFTYNGADIIIYYKLVRSHLKWGLEINNWNFTNSENYLRLSHQAEQDIDPSQLGPERKILFNKNSEQNAFAKFAPALNDTVQIDTNVWFETKAGKNLIHQNMGNSALIELDPTLNIEADAMDGLILYVNELYNSVNTTELMVGMDYTPSKTYDWMRDVLGFDLTDKTNVTSATLYMEYVLKITDTPGTFDLYSINAGASIDSTDWAREEHGLVTEDWFDCSTIVGDISTDVATTWNDAIDNSRIYLDFLLRLDDDDGGIRIDKSNECWVTFTDTGSGTPTYIDYTEFVTSSCTCPASGTWNIVNNDVCTLTSVCSLSAGSDLHIENGSLVIVNGAVLSIPSGGTVIIDEANGSSLAIESGGKMVVHQ